MKKKGIAPMVIVVMIVGVLVGLVVIYAIAFPGQLASKMRDALFSLGLGKLPEERMPSIETRVTGAVYLCDDEKCLDIPPSSPWRRIPESGSPGDPSRSCTDQGGTPKEDCEDELEIRASGLDSGKKCCIVPYCETGDGVDLAGVVVNKNVNCPQGYSEYSHEVSYRMAADSWFKPLDYICCSDDSIGKISDICNEEPSPEDSSDHLAPYNKICGKIGSVAITGPYNVRLYEGPKDKEYKWFDDTGERFESYEGRTICLVQTANLDDYDIWGGQGWKKDTHSVKLFESGECKKQGVTTIVEKHIGERLYLYDNEPDFLGGFSDNVPDKGDTLEQLKDDFGYAGNKDIFYFNIIKEGDAVRFYDEENYGGRNICFRNSGNLFTADFPGKNTWEDDVKSFKIIKDEHCTRPGITTGSES
tara:strand:+ start:270 stop:1520 length:1251 start_codon:yes stop_codon:yes gene_type:complete